jgi:hypothetical protein
MTIRGFMEFISAQVLLDWLGITLMVLGAILLLSAIGVRRVSKRPSVLVALRSLIETPSRSPLSLRALLARPAPVLSRAPPVHARHRWTRVGENRQR